LNSKPNLLSGPLGKVTFSFLWKNHPAKRFSQSSLWHRGKTGICGLICLFGLFIPPLAQSEALKFVYIHGTNQNAKTSKQLFNDDVAKLHPHIKSALENEPLAREHLLDQGKMTIDPESLNFFWGDKSHLAIESVRHNISLPQLSKGVLKLGDRGRRKMSFMLHDAVWVEQQTNKKEIISALYDEVSKTGTQPIMLMGHSAGSLVTFDFLMYRMPYLDIQDFAQDLHANPDVIAKVKANGSQYTCLEALLASSGIKYDMNGKLVPFFTGIESQMPPDLLNTFRNRWLATISDYTSQYCLPQNKVRGLVTFGSPLALFYSLAANPQKDESYLVASMIHYMLANNIAWLHVNHWDDIIALPLPGKARILEVINKRLKKPAELNGGFVESYIYTGSGATFMSAHSWYWRRPQSFSKTVAKAYKIGYQDWYPASK